VCECVVVVAFVQKNRCQAIAFLSHPPLLNGHNERASFTWIISIRNIIAGKGNDRQANGQSVRNQLMMFSFHNSVVE
jgi:hypothetical protein